MKTKTVSVARLSDKYGYWAINLDIENVRIKPGFDAEIKMPREVFEDLVKMYFLMKRQEDKK